MSDDGGWEEQAGMLKELLLDDRIFGPRLVIVTLKQQQQSDNSGKPSSNVERACADVVDAVNASGRVSFPVLLRSASLADVNTKVRAGFDRFGMQLASAASMEADKQQAATKQ